MKENNCLGCETYILAEPFNDCAKCINNSHFKECSEIKPLDIEIVNIEEKQPLEDLLDYLNTEIYTKMSKKDVEAIKSKYLGGELLHEINSYKNKQVYESLVETRKQHADEVNNFKNIIRELRDGSDKSKEVYPENGFTQKD